MLQWLVGLPIFVSLSRCFGGLCLGSKRANKRKPTESRGALGSSLFEKHSAAHWNVYSKIDL